MKDLREIEAALKSLRRRVDSLMAELRGERTRVAREREKFMRDARELEARADEVERLRGLVAAATRESGELKKAIERATAVSVVAREQECKLGNNTTMLMGPFCM